MKKNYFYFRHFRWGLFLYFFLFVSCHKQFDEPPAYKGPDIQPNLFIRDLHKMHFNGNFEQVLDDFIIEGVVVADDSRDNFYKSIVLQDSTGGVIIRLDATGLYTDYPVGRKMSVRLKNLWLGDYAGMIEVGIGVDRTDPVYPELTGIPLPLFDRYLIKKTLQNPIIARSVRLDELNDSLQSCLVRINDVEFSVSDTGRTYADAINKQSVNRTIKACSGGSIYLRTGGFANFANIKIPRGSGSVTAIYSVFNKEKQLLIRDTSDVQMSGIRCTGAGPKVLLNEDFENIITNTEIAISGWKNIAESGAKPYQGKLFSNNHYAEINALASNQASVISWLISPPVNLSNSANEILSFQTKDGFDNGAVLQAYISTNYDGSNIPSKAKWVLLKANISKGSVSGLAADWVASGNISLSGYSGAVFIAFRYEGADPVSVANKHTTSFQIDNVRIVGN
jgi:hypothetical protein